MMLAAVFGLVFIALIAWHAVIVWYLRRYIVQGDPVYKIVVPLFLAGNAIFIAAALALFFSVSWQDISMAILSSNLVQPLGQLLQ